MKDNLNIKGTVFLKLEKKDGSVINKTIENIIVNTGKEFFAKQIFNDSTAGTVTQIGIGRDGTAQVVGNTITSFKVNTFNNVLSPQGPIIKNIESFNSSIETIGGIKNQIDFVTTFYDTAADTLLDAGNNKYEIKELALIGLSGDSPQEDVLLCRTTFGTGDDSPPQRVGFDKATTDVVTVTWRLTIN